MRPRFTVLTLLLAALAACSAPAPAPPAADFGISLSDTVLEAVPGGSFTTSITLSPINGFAGTVALTLANRDGSPADPGLTLDPAAVIVPASALTEQSIQRQLTLDIDPLLAPGSFALRLTATSGPLASDADLDLTVAASLIPSVAITSPTAGTTFIGSRDVTVEGTIAAVSGIVDVVIEGADAIADLSFPPQPERGVGGRGARPGILRQHRLQRR